MELRSADLNLLVVLDMLVRERSVTAAAERLNLTQSAVSHSLRRLRVMFDDEIMVRIGGRMQPTPVAHHLVEKLAPALNQVAEALASRRGFVPGQSNRCFDLRVSEYVLPALLEPLCTRVRLEAPYTRLNILPSGGSPAQREIAPGEVHIRAERGAVRHARPASQLLFQDDFVVMMSEGHQAASGAMTLEHYVALPHVKVVAEAVGTNMIDTALSSLGLRRNIVLTVPGWFGLRRAVAGTDLVAAVPRHWVSNMAFMSGCLWRELPLDDVTLTVDLAWNARDASDLGIGWLRGMLVDLLSAASG